MKVTDVKQLSFILWDDGDVTAHQEDSAWLADMLERSDYQHVKAWICLPPYEFTKAVMFGLRFTIERLYEKDSVLQEKNNE